MSTDRGPRPATGVTAPLGFRAAGVTAGLKPSGSSDLAVVVCDGPRQDAAGVFTRNRVQAAPVLWSRQVVAGGRVGAVLLNSGGANACTGAAGFATTHASAEATARALQAQGLDVGAGQVAVCSTGVIGVHEDVWAQRLLAGVPDVVAAATHDGGAAAAQAVMTTDTVAKQAVAHVDVTGADDGARVTVGGLAKGAAMLAPALATMLAVVTTDAVAPPAVLDRVLRAATATSFDRVDTDACMSTNDTVLLVASGASDVEPDVDALADAVAQVCADLARQMVDDAEGATKHVRVHVTSAATTEDAREVARAVGRSTLLKCALAGEDPNWGRVLSAVGTTAAAFDPDRLDVDLQGVGVCRGGVRAADESLVDLSGRHVEVHVDLHAGGASDEVWTTDLTTEYVRLNAEYTT